MAWTNFASLGVGPGTTPELDANFLILSGLSNIPCTVSGTNTLVLTQSTTTGTIAAYANYLNLVCVAAATNTGGVTANYNSLGALNVYKDTATGPALLTGAEIVQNCQFTLVYDATLNANAGGFHLRGGGGSPSSTITSLSVSNLYVGGTGNPLVRMQSTLTSFSITAGNTLVPGAEALATISFAGCVVGDNILASPPTPSASLNYVGYVGASNSIIFRVHNTAVSSTITVSLFTIRFTDIGFAS